jgi:hypothetical protein
MCVIIKINLNVWITESIFSQYEFSFHPSLPFSCFLNGCYLNFVCQALLEVERLKEW